MWRYQILRDFSGQGPRLDYRKHENRMKRLNSKLGDQGYEKKELARGK
jgi:hypothetical protein